MNSAEIGIYIALTHPTARENYRITNEGARIYVLVDGGLAYFEGKNLDKMGSMELYRWVQYQIMDLRRARYG
jgi:hypothetical protein